MYRPTVWRLGEKNEPKFPVEYDILRTDVLQSMDVSANTNKFYCMVFPISDSVFIFKELHVSNVASDDKYKYTYRIFTQHGRTEELTANKRGTCETRYLSTLEDAEVATNIYFLLRCQILYTEILDDKLTQEKGYHKVDLLAVSSLIGSKSNADSQPAPVIRELPTSSLLLPAVQNLVRYYFTNTIPHRLSFVFAEASDALTKSITSKITTKGIETPLGIVSLDQIFRGEQVLEQISHLVSQKVYLQLVNQLIFRNLTKRVCKIYQASSIQ